MTKVDRRTLIKAGGAVAAGAVATAVAAPAIAQSSPEIRWRMATSWPKSLDTLYGGAEWIGKRVAAMTDNKFQIQACAGGEIVPGLQVLDAVQNGTVEAGHTAMYYYFGKDDTFVFPSALPFGMNSRMQNAWMLHGGGLDVLNEFLKSYNAYMIPAGNTNCQMGGWFRKALTKMDDMKGLKMRLGGFAGKIVQRIGVVPQQIAGGDIYPALEKGTVDAAEWVGPYDDEKLGFNKVAPYYYTPGFWEGGPMLHVLVNEKKYAELPKHYQAALHAACGEASTWMPAKYDAQNPDAMRRLVAGGTKLRRFPTVVLEAAEKAAYEVYEEMNSKSAHWKRIYPGWKKFRDEQIQWFRVAESTYDNYMMNSKVGQPAGKPAAKKS